MRVLVTGHLGYIGAVLAPMVRDAGHEVVGLDSGLYAGMEVQPLADPPGLRGRPASDPRTGDYSCGTVIAEVLAPERLGRLLMVSHGPSWPWWSEVEREPPTGTAGGACTATTPDGPLTRATH